MEHTIEFSNTKDKEYITGYVSEINSLFDSIDIFSDNNIWRKINFKKVT